MSRSIFGWSLPPGVSRLPGEEPERVQPRCPHCQAFLPYTPHRTEGWEDSRQCDGKVKSVDEPYSDELIRILGDEYQGKTYKIYYCDCEWDLGANAKDHEPHKVIEYAGTTAVWNCKNCKREVRINEY